MQCIKCNHVSVCKHYTYMMDNLCIGIKIEDCKLFSQKQSSENTPMPKEATTFEANNKETIKIEKEPKLEYTDFSSLGKEIIAPLSAIPVEINKVCCDRCKKEVFSTEIENCLDCGRPVCVDCRVSTFDATSGDVTAVCEKCWSGTEDPVEGEESEVSISYEKEKDKWDLSDFIDKENLSLNENTEEKEVAQEEKDVRTKKVGNPGSNKKSKKQ